MLAARRAVWKGFCGLLPGAPCARAYVASCSLLASCDTWRLLNPQPALPQPGKAAEWWEVAERREEEIVKLMIKVSKTQIQFHHFQGYKNLKIKVCHYLVLNDPSLMCEAVTIDFLSVHQHPPQEAWQTVRPC